MGASAASMMPEAWRQFVGQVAAGEFPLREYLGGSSRSAVFLTERGDRTAKAAIKLVPVPRDAATADLVLARWDLAARFSHPRLLRLFEHGRCRLGGAEFLYVVSEFADEDLSQILPQRALTSAEAGDMLRSLLDALHALDDQSLVHGRIKPANVMAAADVIKLSSDSLSPAGGSRIPSPRSIPLSIYDAPELATGSLSPAADLWSLGVLLVETLTQRLPVSKPGHSGEPALPANIPSPFREIVRHCLRRDPARRWTVADIRAHLARTSSVPAKLAESAAPQSRPTRPGATIADRISAKRLALPVVLAALALVAVTAAVKLTGNRRKALPPAPTEMANRTQPMPPAATPSTPDRLHPSRRAASSSQASSSQASSTQPKPTPGTQAEPARQAPASTPSPDAATQGAVAHEVLPNVSQSALHTISGTVKVRVRIKVDRGGNVIQASLESRGPSPYFARLALAAANGWKFTPQAEAQPPQTEWRLLFEFRRDGTRALPTEIK